MHPVADASWEGFVIETMISAAPAGTLANVYRTAAAAEIDLLLTPPGGRPCPIEIKSRKGLLPRLRGSRSGQTHRHLSGCRKILLRGDVEAMPLTMAAVELMHRG
jgi:uncharacterized protein